MGGKGELVSYKRIRAKTPKQRQDLKKTVGYMVDQTSEEITVIVLTNETPATGKGSGKGRGK